MCAKHYHIGVNKNCVDFYSILLYEFITSLMLIIVIYFSIKIIIAFRDGVIRPCRIGEDGKPTPIEHVLELQSELPKQQYGRKDSDSE